MNIAFLEDSTPVDGMLKVTEGTVYQVFDADGRCIMQQFIASDEVTRYSPALKKPIAGEDSRFSFYHPFKMEEPRNFCQKFVCEGCGCDQLEEIMTDVTMSSQILAVDNDGDISYGAISAGDSGEVGQFQCAGCGKVVAHSVTELCEVMGVEPPESDEDD